MHKNELLEALRDAFEYYAARPFTFIMEVLCCVGLFASAYIILLL